ncbi:hypothetical protein Patl1_04684 [Pistacia atlantica]|uniref:Uncharacterized protein n=1 Tax=Pistacia atlantica TaxID=434234 RepID=A0ACC1BS31_9ROSI|nr:hypothetical protein Patl1_04684 [Pistacia atlantica]
MATPNPYLTTPTKTPSEKSSSKRHHNSSESASARSSRFEAYNRLQAAAVAFGEKLPIPEIVALGGQSDGKSSLLEALLGFRFNVREVEMGTRRPLILQMVHDPTAVDPRCRFQALFSRQRRESRRTRPDEILSMVKSLASPPHRILLFLQQSSVEWCSSLWLDAVREIDPTFRRTVIVVSKFDNRLKEFGDRWEVDRQISQVDSDVQRHLREGIKGGYDEEKFKSNIGFGCLRDFLESELQKRYKEAAPATLALLEQRCTEVTTELARMDSKMQATSDVAHLRRYAMLHAASISNHVGALIDGAADPAPEQWGKTTAEEQSESGIGSWPGVVVDVKPPNATLRLYGGAAFERVIHEFRCAAYSIECPPVSREKVANILLAHAGRGGSRGITEAAAEIARAAARSWFAPLLDTACDRLAFVLGNLFDLALERNRSQDSEYGRKSGNMDGYVSFHAALRHAYSRFVKDLAKQCKKLVRHHLDSVTSPYSLVCYENECQGGFGSGISNYKFNQASAGSFCFELSDGGAASRDETMRDQENIPPQKNTQQTTPGKGEDGREALRECQMTVPETPSPDQPCDVVYAAKKEPGNFIEVGPRKRISRMTGNRNGEHLRVQNGGGLLFGNGDRESGSRSNSAFSEICLSAAQHFARIREVLVERSVTSTLNSGFLTPCRDRLVVAIGLDLFAVNDEKFMDMFVAPGAMEVLENERKSLEKRQKILQSCLNEFKNVARSL